MVLGGSCGEGEVRDFFSFQLGPPWESVDNYFTDGLVRLFPWSSRSSWAWGSLTSHSTKSRLVCGELLLVTSGPGDSCRKLGNLPKTCPSPEANGVPREAGLLSWSNRSKEDKKEWHLVSSQGQRRGCVCQFRSSEGGTRVLCKSMCLGPIRRAAVSPSSPTHQMQVPLSWNLPNG